MTARMYYDVDTDPSALAGQTVAIIGYGSQGHAHARNLHDSGVKVIVGLPATSKSRALATEERRRLRTIVDYMKPAHTHFARLVEPLIPEVLDHLELGLSELGETWLLH